MVDGGVEGTAAEVPESVVDGADGHHEDACAGVAVETPELVPGGVAGEGVFTDEEGADLLVNDDGGFFVDRAIEAFKAFGTFELEVDGGDGFGAILWGRVFVDGRAEGIVDVEGLDLVLGVDAAGGFAGTLVLPEFDGFDFDVALLGLGGESTAEEREGMAAIHAGDCIQ